MIHMQKSKTITINEKEVEIKKIPIGKFADLMMVIDKLPNTVMDILSQDGVKDINNLSNAEMLGKIPKLLAKSQDEVFNLVSVASGVPKKEFKEMDPEEFLDVLETLIEVNNIQTLIDRVKNLKVAFQTKMEQ